MKKKRFWSLIKMSMAFIPLSLAANCNVVTSLEDKNQNSGDGNQGGDGNKNPGGGDNQNPNQNQDALSKELQKLTYTGLSDEDLQNLVISDSTILDESIAEQLGFILPDTIKGYIEKQEDAEAAEYKLKVSKAKGSLEVIYKYQKTGEEKEKIQKVTMIPYQENDITTILNDLKTYNRSYISGTRWNYVSAEGFNVTVDSAFQDNILQIRGLKEHAETILANKNDIKAYVRKVKDHMTMKYLVVKTITAEKKIIKIGDSITVIPAAEGVATIIKVLKKLETDKTNPLSATTTSDDFKTLVQTRIQVLPKDANNPFDWSSIKIIAPSDTQLPDVERLQHARATKKGKLEIEKKSGEITLHWYITYVDINDKFFTDEYIMDIKFQ